MIVFRCTDIELREVIASKIREAGGKVKTPKLIPVTPFTPGSVTYAFDALVWRSKPLIRRVKFRHCIYWEDTYYGSVDMADVAHLDARADCPDFIRHWPDWGRWSKTLIQFHQTTGWQPRDGFVGHFQDLVDRYLV
jgi:hypothetical protein